MQPLFLESSLDFEKTSAQTQLPEDPNSWPQEVLQELYKQAPYISDFSPHVVMEKVDGEQGYGLGHVEVANQTEIQTATSPEMMQSAGVRQVRVPIVIKDGMLQPFDLLVSDDSKILPLTEVRLRAAIFRPQAFDVTSRTPGDQSMIGQLYPPYRQNQGFGGGGTMMNVGMGKEGSASALEAYLTEKTAWDFMTQEEAHDPEFRGPQPGDFEIVNGKKVPMKFDAKYHKSGKKPAWAPATWQKGKEGLEVVREKKADGHCDSCDGGDKCKCSCAMCKTACMGKTAGALSDFADQFMGADYLHAKEGSSQSRAGKKVASGAARVGMMDELLAKTASTKTAMSFEAANRLKRQLVKAGSVLEAILPTLNDADVREFKQVITSPELEGVLYKNASTIAPFIQLILERPVRQKTASVFTHLLQPSVVQLRRLDEGYRVKAASHFCWEPLVQHIDRGAAISRFGEKVVIAADLNGSVTMAEGADAFEPEAEEGDADLMGGTSVTQPGCYRVRTPDGNETVGYVIPNLIDVDGTVLPLALFMNGEEASIQTDVVGVPCDEHPDLPEADVPKGRGVFATADGPEGPMATVPLTIDATLAGIGSGEPMSYRAESFTGQQVLVSCQPNIQTVQAVDGKMLVPDSWRWIPLDQAKEVAVESEEDGQKLASIERELASVQLVSAGGATFSLRGDHVEKLGHDEREQLGIDDTMFLLAGLGVELGYGTRKMAQAIGGEAPVRVRVGREIKLASDERAAALERARGVLDSFPIARQQLFKEAATLGDPQAVDTVLSLGFLNPENLNTFISYLPVLEDAQGKLCDILLASRLGTLIDTPEGAIERAVRSVEAVLEGLKALAFQQN